MTKGKREREKEEKKRGISGSYLTTPEARFNLTIILDRAIKNGW